jgi:NADPH:quinone reductase-like Zn-dependent oxidoreductase
MKAIRLHEFGGPEVLRHEEVPVPEPGPGEVLVRVHAVGINPPDWYAREGMPDVPPELKPPFDLPLIPGTDVSGVVEAVAADVDDFAVGDEVVGLLRFPTALQGSAYAEYVTAPASDLARKPAAIDHVHAAGLPMSGLTAWQFLIELGHDHPSPFQEAQHRPMALDSETTVLVNGAAGGVGHLALQLAKWKGARVIAVASGAHERFLHELGADEFIDYTRDRPEEVARDVDLVLDTVGGPDSRRFLRTLKHGGSLYPVYFGEFDDEENAELGVTVTAAQVRSNGAQLAEIGRLLEDGTIRVAIDSTFPLKDAQAAHERAAQGHLQGKIVLTIA